MGALARTANNGINQDRQIVMKMTESLIIQLKFIDKD
jgi:hypothetical protein